MTTCLGKSCSFGLPRVPFVNCCQFMYLVISLLVLRAGYWILLYQFQIIAYLFTFPSKELESMGHMTMFFACVFANTEPGGISGMKLVRYVAGPPHTHPINVYWDMEKSMHINV